MTSKQADSAEKRRREIEEALDQMIEDTIRRDGPRNTAVWVAVALGGFLLNLGLLVLVAGA